MSDWKNLYSSSRKGKKLDVVLRKGKIPYIYFFIEDEESEERLSYGMSFSQVIKVVRAIMNEVGQYSLLVGEKTSGGNGKKKDKWSKKKTGKAKKKQSWSKKRYIKEEKKPVKEIDEALREELEEALEDEEDEDWR